MATDYNALKVAELKDLLKERGIPSTGLSRKQQFVDALQANDGGTIPPRVGEDIATKEEVEEEAIGEAGVREAETGLEEEKVEAAVDAVQKADEKVVEEGANGDSEMADAVRQPSVLEADQPVDMVTPSATSPVPEDASSDTRKRKRRSVTPPVSAESVSKKLKAGEDVVQLPEDAKAEEMVEDAKAEEMVEDAPAQLDGAADVKQPFGSSDDVMDGPSAKESLKADAPRPDTTDTDTARSGAIHPATRALYIRDLIRPIQPNQLQDHLTHLAGTGAEIETFHLDTLRTHAFAVFASISDASRVRSKLHNTVFPDEPTRRPLWVDFIPEEKVQDWIEQESSSGTSRRDAKKWEISYSTSDFGDVVCELREAVTVQPPPTGPGRQQSLSSQQQPRRESAQPSRQTRSPELERSAPPPPPAQSNKSFNILDENFRFTETKPKLYFLPKPVALADDRLDELKRQTSRDWTGARREDFEGPQLRRYTFEDGDRLVDNGPDRGSFGVPEFARRGGGGFGGGRGRGGGFGGERWRR